MPLSHPVADHAALRGAAADISDGKAAEQYPVVAAEQEERHGMAGPVFIMAAMNPSAEGRLRQFVILPDRLPWLQEGAAFGTQHPPLVETLMLGQAQPMWQIGRASLRERVCQYV